MAQDEPDLDDEEPLCPRRLAPSASILGAYIALSAALGHDEVVGGAHDKRTVDLLLRLEMSPDKAMRAVDLCEQLMVSASHTSRLIDRVEALGLVERTPDPDDRRANQVVLTKEGCEVVSQIAHHFMLGPGWDEGCPSCSFWADNYSGIRVFLSYQTFSRGLDMLNGAYHILDLTLNGRDEAELAASAS